MTARQNGHDQSQRLDMAASSLSECLVTCFKKSMLFGNASPQILHVHLISARPRLERGGRRSSDTSGVTGPSAPKCVRTVHR